MTHKDKFHTGYSEAFEKGWNKIQKDQRVKCKSCGDPISKFYAKHHNNLCRICYAKSLKWYTTLIVGVVRSCLNGV